MTGGWCGQHPVYADRTPPCDDACPTGEGVRRWLYDAQEGLYEKAWHQIMRDNPFPAITGRVCHHPCQRACNRGQLDGAVDIRAVERFIGDEAIRRGWAVPVETQPTGKRVLVVGAGAAGMAAAYHLTLAGHEVTVRDAADQAGGMMRYAVPAYRLPCAVLDAELDRVVRMGVDLRLGQPVEDLAAVLTGEGFDAAFVAIGAQLGRRLEIPADGAARVLDALTVLRGAAAGDPPRLGRRVVVYGGDATALAVARTALRLDATDVMVVYRRTRDRMPAQPSEVAEAEEEGVRVRCLSTVTAAGPGTVTVERMWLDETGFPQPSGECETVDADSVVLAIGREVAHSLLAGLPRVEVVNEGVRVGPDLMTGHPGVFAGGDAVPSLRTVAVAVGHGRTAARHLDGWLRGTRYAPPPRPPLATFERLNTWYYSDAPATPRPRLAVSRRTGTFDEVFLGLDEAAALFESRRCLSCGTCFACDNCFGMCPDSAVRKRATAPGPPPRSLYDIDLAYCKGCGICASECPSGAIDMVRRPH